MTGKIRQNPIQINVVANTSLTLNRSFEAVEQAELQSALEEHYLSLADINGDRYLQMDAIAIDPDEFESAYSWFLS